MISNKGLVGISAFMNSCDDLINGKFISATNKIAKILESINDSPELYEVISECIKEFNYDKEFGRARVKLPTKKGVFKMPEENITIIPLVFCMLVDIQNDKIEFKQFLADYFDTDDEVSQFENFARGVILPFKNAIAYLFDIEGGNKFKPGEQTNVLTAEKKEVNNKTAKYLKDVQKICEDILADLEFIKMKEEVFDDIKYLAETVKFAASKNDVKMVNALSIGLCYVIKKVRKLRFYEYQIRNAMEDLYLD